MSGGRRASSAAAGTLALGLVLAAAACGANRAPEDGRGETDAVARDTVTGTVRQVGSTPFARTVVEGESASATVVGPLAGELTRLVGARVRVAGPPAEGEFPGLAIRVESYEVLSVDGDEPLVGILRHEAGAGYRIETAEGEAVPLRAVSSGLGAAAGGKVWVVVDETGGVLRYGVLREP